MEEAKTAFERGDFGKALEPLWDEVYEAARRRDSEQLESVKTLAEKIEQASASDKRTRTKAMRLVVTATEQLAAVSPPVEATPA